MIEHHLPVLIVLVPLFGALLSSLTHRGSIAWGVALLATVLTLAGAIALLARVTHEGVISYEIGGWAPPVGIEYRVDMANALVILIVASIAAVIVPYARVSVAREIAADQHAWFYTMYLLCVTGLIGIAVTGDAFNAFVFLEVSSLATYTLIALGPSRRSLLSAYQYLIMGTIGATFYIIGVGLLLTITGTLNFVDLAARIADTQYDQALLAAFAFITVGIGLKLALFPLHVWLPNAYAKAPSTGTALLASTATKVAVYLLVRIYFSVFGVDKIIGDIPVLELLLILSIAAMFFASIVAVFEKNVKRLLAYSSVAQVGYMILGVSMATTTALTGTLVHLANHALMKGAAFLAIGAVAYQLGSVSLDRMKGVGRVMPITMGCFVVAGLSLIGVPGTVGFISKYYLVIAAFEKGWWWLAFLIVASSLIAVFYVGRVVEVAWFSAPDTEAAELRDPPLLMLVPTIILAAACVFFGVDASLTAGLAEGAANVLFGGYQ
ncbi:MAG: monovalent cation/H+ antiporter subunit D family protein [Rhodobiaceae bacterium]|nr:monovalent cation/H+ antiporter subunit D family protein [Rhodobiaceae bacterium]MCC0016606.1 monovalent cation/H+ antiporter subunit D family protein [Rhodobiaceae bacterium]MCC0042257.1 monovalent cation/H+ antiporter subunit D family protein [Rhodobiaceae bacterium]